MSHVYNRVALIGLGLIAGSMALAMRRGNLAGEVVGYAKSEETRRIAEEIGLCDRIAHSAAEAVQDADLVVLCVPVGAMGAVAQEISHALKTGTTVSDVGSVKGAVIDAVAPHIPQGVHFVPAHPLAGTEKSGPRAGFAELFDNRWCLLVPQEGSDPVAVKRLRHLWEAMGANVEGVNIGDVVSGEGHIVCERCRNCLAGRRHLCPNTIGIGVNRTGCFAEYLSIPAKNIFRPSTEIRGRVSPKRLRRPSCSACSIASSEA